MYRLNVIVRFSSGEEVYTVERSADLRLADTDKPTILELIDELDNVHIANGEIITDATVINVKGRKDYINVVVTGYNDLETWCRKTGNEKYLKEYSPKNKIPANKIGRAAGTDALWKCSKCGYEWHSLISNRCRQNSGCPACTAALGKATYNIEGVNDFESWCLKNDRIDLLEEYSSDNELLPNQLSAFSHKGVLWKCKKCGYKWETELAWRTSKGNGCPVCPVKNGAGHKLIQGVNDLETYCNKHDRYDILYAWADENELKPSQVAGKSDTLVFLKCSHCNKVYKISAYSATRRKNTLCKNCSPYGTSIPQIMWYKVLKSRFSDVSYRQPIRGGEADICINNSLVIEYNGMKHIYCDGVPERDKKKKQKFRDLGFNTLVIQEQNKERSPQIDRDKNTVYVHYSLNKSTSTFNSVIPFVYEMLGSSEIKEVTEEELSKAYREALKQIGLRVLKGNIAETHPAIASTWDYEKNFPLKPEAFTYGSHIKVWWKCSECKEPHSYYRSIKSRMMGRACPEEIARQLQRKKKK